MYAKSGATYQALFKDGAINGISCHVKGSTLFIMLDIVDGAIVSAEEVIPLHCNLTARIIKSMSNIKHGNKISGLSSHIEDEARRLAEIVCEAWNKLDALLLKPILSEDFEYSSCWIFSIMEGKQTYMEYITDKFQTIRADGIEVVADIVNTDRGYKPHLCQNGTDHTILDITIENGLISKMYMVPYSLYK